MTEQEMMKKIQDSAGQVKVPESLLPEHIKKKLDGQQATIENKVEFYRKKKFQRGLAVAAVTAVIVLAGTTVVYKTGYQGDNLQLAEVESKDASGKSDISGTSGEAGEEDGGTVGTELGVETEKETNLNIAAVENKQDAGEYYVVANDYGNVYDVLNSYYDSYYDTHYLSEIGGELALTESADMSVGDGAMEKTSDSAYSQTNLQVQGVDESDIVKTDGSYIYMINNSGEVCIIDVRSEKMKEVGTITVESGNDAGYVEEMYVEGDSLSLIVEKEITDLMEQETGVTGETSSEGAFADIIYLMNTNTETEIITYDISDRSNPKKIGAMTQDGRYKSSRKIGDVIYLFTEKTLENPQNARESAVLEDNLNGWIPVVNGKTISADCIYLPKQGNQGLIITSTNVKQPNQVVDQVMIINESVEIYMSQETFYLYNVYYGGDHFTTQIAKFFTKDGGIDAVGATSVTGIVTDTFAVHDEDGRFRILTTDLSNGQTSNNLYLFDEKLKNIGKLQGIAEDETIYAARYLGDIVYFVTYRNTDPLFAVDLSDEKNPKILSELKITGFSEYLHFWGENQLLGLGYESDPDRGSLEGIKLVMFDISDPRELKTLGSTVIKDLDYTPAIYDYKAILADPEENLIGFAGENHGEDVKKSYYLYTWENGVFEELLKEDIEKEVEQYRGIYVGDRFYLVEMQSITAFDRTDNYKKMETLSVN